MEVKLFNSNKTLRLEYLQDEQTGEQTWNINTQNLWGDDASLHYRNRSQANAALHMFAMLEEGLVGSLAWKIITEWWDQTEQQFYDAVEAEEEAGEAVNV